MTRKAIATHAIILVTALLAAWWTYTSTRAPGADTQGVVLAEGEAAAITWEDGAGTTLTIAARQDDRGRWFDGTLTVTPPDDDNASTPTPAPKVIRFRGNAGVARMWRELEPLRALRVLDALTPDKRKELGLDGPKETLTVTFGSGTATLKLGGTVFGGADRYAMTSTGKAVVVPGGLTSSLTGKIGAVRETRLLGSTRADISGLTVKSGGRTLALTQHDQASVQRAFWSKKGGRAGDDRFKTWVNSLLTMQASETLDGAPQPSWKLALEVTVERGGEPYEGLKLYELPTKTTEDPAFRVVSDHLRLTAKVPTKAAAGLVTTLTPLFDHAMR